MSLDLTDDIINMGSGNGLVPAGNNPLHEPMLTQMYQSDVTGPQWVKTHCSLVTPYGDTDLGQNWLM